MLRTLLERAVHRWRTGQWAWGVLCWKTYEKHRTTSTAIDEEVSAAIASRDCLRAADIVEHVLLPVLTT